MRRSLRIALVLNPFTLRQRSGDHARALARELIGRGHAVRGFGVPPGVVPRSGASLMPGIRGFVPDALLAYDGLSPAGSHSAAVARRAGVPLFVAEQGFPTRGRPVERGLRWVGERLWGPRVRRSLCGVVALDDLAQAQALEFGVGPDQVHLVPGGIDPALHRRGLRSHLLERHGVRGHVVLAAGPLLPGRGLRGLVRAYAATLGALEDWTLVIAGEGPLGRELEALANIKGVSSGVVIVERPRAEELPALVGAATLMVDADRSGRGPRRTTLGGLASGTPLLAVPGSRFASLARAEAGLEVEGASVEDLAQGLRTAAGDPVRRERWAEAATRLGADELSWSRVAERVEGLLLGDPVKALAGVSDAPAEEPPLQLRRA
jgi:glycosyltransferase involved in cell wall biosynthesis